jgi:hypothetical protein
MFGIVTALLVLMIAIPLVAQAEENTFNLTFKQGLLYYYNVQQVKNISCLELAKTKPVDTWGNWNALWEGWSLDGAVSYDAIGVKSAALLIGRNFGTLGKYLPLDFPLADKFTVTLYPFGIAMNNPFDEPEIEFVSGLAYLTINW